LRVALTGAAVSPGIFEVASLMGKDLVLARIDAAIHRLAMRGDIEPAL
jgi:glutamyl/glutaminyl-tRNA synthetase